jgi:hypothetical protein
MIEGTADHNRLTIAIIAGIITRLTYQGLMGG